MPDAPRPVTSPPRVPGQPYDAADSGPANSGESESEHVYDADGGGRGRDPWPKVQAGGAADWMTGQVHGKWPNDGTSDGSAWKQA
jgi:hypothetical protein